MALNLLEKFFHVFFISVELQDLLSHYHVFPGIYFSIDQACNIFYKLFSTLFQLFMGENDILLLGFNCKKMEELLKNFNVTR